MAVAAAFPSTWSSEPESPPVEKVASPSVSEGMAVKPAPASVRSGASLL